MVVASPAPPSAPLAGRFRLLERIGKGGMGEVWRAEDQRSGGFVAVKLLRAVEDEDAEKMATRFLREAQRTAQFDHPNIVHVIDYGTEPGGGLYLAMEYLPGETLRRAQKREGRLAPARVVRLALQACAALARVHAAGLVHRDLKPGNLMLLPGAPERAVLIDFGIARGDDQETQLTSTGLFVGTAEFCAPEQIRAEPIDGRTDQYSLGVVLYFALTGTLPFEGPGLAAMMHQHLSEPPPPLSQRGVEVPPALEAVLFRCLAKRPADRFATVQELGAALEAVGRAHPLAEAACGAAMDPIPAGPVSQRVAERFAALEPPGAPAPAASQETALPPPERRGYSPKIELAPRAPVAERRGREAHELSDPGSRRARTLVSVLSMLARLAAFHPAKDPALRLPLAHLRAAIEEVLLVDGALELEVEPPLLRLNGRRVEVPPEGIESLTGLANLLAFRGLTALSAPRPPTSADLERFVSWLGATSDETPEELAGRMTSLKLSLSSERPGDRAPTRPARPRTVVVAWARACRFVAEYRAATARKERADSSGAMAFAEEFAALSVARRPLFAGLSLRAAPADPAAAHLANVAALAVAFGAELGLTPAQVRDLAYVGLFHGVGLAEIDPVAPAAPALRAAVVQAPLAVVVAALGERDAAPVLWRRAVTGFERAVELAAPVSEAARAHRPGPGLRARILTLCSVFEALASGRPGRAPLAPAQALQAMGERLCDRLDRELFAPFARLLGSLVSAPLAPSDSGARLVPEAGAVRLLACAAPLADAALRARVQRAARDEDGPEFWQRLSAMVGFLAEQGPESERLLELVLPVFDGLLLQEEFGPAAELLGQLRALQRRGPAEGPASRLSFLLASRLSDEERLLHVGQVLRRAPVRAPRELLRFLALLEPAAAPGLLDALGTLEIAENRALLVEALAPFARRSPAPFLARIEGAKGLLAGDLAAVLQRAGHPQLVPLLAAAAASGSPRVKAQLFEVAARLRTGEARAFVSGYLDDPAPQVRLAALRCLPGCGEAEAARELLARAAGPDFASRAPAEREAVLSGLAATATAEALRFLEQVLAKKAPMLGRGKVVEEKLAVVSALCLAPSIHAARLLRGLAADQKQPSEVLEAARAALGRVHKSLGLTRG